MLYLHLQPHELNALIMGLTVHFDSYLQACNYMEIACTTTPYMV